MLYNHLCAGTPEGLALHKEEIFFADSYNHSVCVFNQFTGKFFRQFGKSGRSSEHLFHPTTVAVSSDGEVFVGSLARHDITVFNLDTSFKRIVRVAFEDPLLRYPINYALLFADDDVLFVSLGWASRELTAPCVNPYLVDKYEVSAVCKKSGKVFKTYCKGELKQPQQLAIDLNELFITESNNSRIVVVDKQTGVITRQYLSPAAPADPMNFPSGVAVHGDQVIVCDKLKSRLILFDRGTAQVVKVIKGPISPVTRTWSLETPHNLVVNSHNELYVSDPMYNRILVFQ